MNLARKIKMIQFLVMSLVVATAVGCDRHLSDNVQVVAVESEPEDPFYEAWGASGLTAKDLEEKLNNSTCNRNNEQALACLMGIDSMLRGTKKLLFLVPRDLLSRGTLSVDRIVRDFGELILVEGELSGRHAATQTQYSALIAEFLGQRRSRFTQLVQGHAIDFDELRVAVLHLYQKAKIPVAVAVGQFYTGELLTSDPRYRLEPNQVVTHRGPGPAGAEAILEVPFELAFLENGRPRVARTSAGSRAQGLRQGDVILRIGDVLTDAGYEAARVAFREDSKKKGALSLVVLRGTEEISINLKLKGAMRPLVESEVRVPAEGRKVGYLRIGAFKSGVCSEVHQRLLQFLGESVFEVALDLRGNPGGDIGEVACIATLLVGEGLPLYDLGLGVVRSSVFSHVSPSEESNSWFKSLIKVYRAFSIVLLQDGLSASGSELLAGILRFHRRAFVVGARSFGKGTYQERSIWSKGSRVAEWKTGGNYRVASSNLSPDNVGIEPDFVVPWRINGESDVANYVRQADEYRNMGLPVNVLNGPIEPVAITERLGIADCIDMQALNAKSESLFGLSSQDFDYPYAFAEEVLGCLANRK